MYINLPSKNHYRRPASYTSKGYHTRRMAVDFAVPLITNVKNAKMLAEALVRKLPLEVSSVDSKSSHRTHTFPGLINVAAFVPQIAIPKNKALTHATEASISAGFTTALFLPIGDGSTIVDRASLEQARSSVAGFAHCNFGLSITATAGNVHTLDDELQAEAKALFVPADTPVSVVAAHFTTWPVEKMIVTDAKGSELSSILLLASLYNRSVHVTDVRSNEDLLLISLSKAKQLKVTCDVSLYVLFFTKEQYPQSCSLLSVEDQNLLWKKLDVIDIFSVGAAPYRLAKETGHTASAWSGIQEALPLLLTAVTDGRLTLEDIRIRLHDNPVHVFGLPDQAQTHVEVVIGRKSPFGKRTTCWSPIEQTSVSGAIHRVVVHGHTVFLDGSLFSTPLGHDISATPGTHVSTISPATLLSPSTHWLSFKDTEVPTQSNMLPPSTAQPSGSIATNLLSHLVPHPSFHQRHILAVKQFSHRDVHELFALANEMRVQVERNGTLDILKGKVLCTMFYEPSTRTSSSFDAAMKRCGGQVVQVTADSSSVLKGESLEDTVRSLACYGDAIVIRHPDVGSAQLAAKFSSVPIINAGDGIGEHPTQVNLLLPEINS